MMGMFRSRSDKKMRKPSTSQDTQGKDSRYIHLGKLGKGGFGEVERCFDKQLNRIIARKVLHHNSKEDPHRINYLVNEARLVCYLDHPGIVPIYDIHVSESGQLSYTMKLLEGQNLHQHLQTAGDGTLLPLSRCLQIFTKICETMAFAHDKGVLHLDLKPANVMVGSFGQVMILDWGTAKLYNPSRYQEFLQASNIPYEGNELHDPIEGSSGSLCHMPLEQMIHQRDTLTPAADVFSAGVLLYHLLSGTSPYNSNDIQSYALDLVTKPVQPIQELRSDLPPQLAAICMKMLETNHLNRYPNFVEVLADLEELATSGRRFQQRTYAPGEILMRQGDVGEFALLIVEGEVEISIELEGGRQVLATCSKGEMIGELAIFSHQLRMATVTALTPTTTRVMTQGDIETEIDKLPPWVGQMVKGLSNKFIDRHLPPKA